MNTLDAFYSWLRDSEPEYGDCEMAVDLTIDLLTALQEVKDNREEHTFAIADEALAKAGKRIERRY